MSLAEISVKKPVLAVMISMIFVVFGLISYFMVGVQANPKITFPVVVVTTNLPGGNAEIINQTITKPIEEVLNTIAGISTIDSNSSPGNSKVTVQFQLGTDIDAAFNAVQTKLNQIVDQLPKGVKPPIIQKENTDDAPIMMLALKGNRSVEDLDDIARNIIQKKLQSVTGVAQARIEGASNSVVMIKLNLAKMAALGISPGNIQTAFTERHVELPGGFVRSGNKSYILNLDLEFHSLEKLNGIVITYRNNAPIYLKDLASIEFAVLDKEHVASLNGQTALGISIIKRPGANTVALVQEVQKRLKTMRPLIPKDVEVKVIYEEASYILAVVDQLEEDIILSILAAGLVIWLFLRSLRSTLIIITAIPISLLGAVLAIYFCGYTLNVITLLGIILLVGVVVDDAIVVLENIHREMEHSNTDRKEAAIKGCDQVVFAVLAATLSLVCIFVPVIFMGGTLGLFFKSFAVVITAGVLISLLVSITLTPVLCAQYLQLIKVHSPLYNYLENGFVALETYYKNTLDFSLRHRWFMVAMVFASILLSIPIFSNIGKGFMPEEGDTGRFQIMVQTAQGYSTQFTKSRMAEAEKKLATIKGIETYFATIEKDNSGTIQVTLVPPDKRTKSQADIIDEVQKALNTVPGGMFIISKASGGSSMSFEVHGEDYKGTVNAAFNLYSALNKEEQLRPLYIHIALDQPQYQLVVDRNRGSSLGFTANEIGSATMVLSNQGIQVGKFNKDSGRQRYDIVIKVDNNEYVNGEDLGQIYLRNEKGVAVSLDTISNFVTSVAPLEIVRRDQEYSVPFTASPKISLGSAIDLVEEIAKKTLPPGYSIAMTGDTASMGDTMRSMALTLALILVLMYMVLASQFNSFLQPFIIMVAQPLALIGGIFVLWISHETLNIYSMIGALLLMGLVAKNSILLIDLTNQYRQEGKSIDEALVEACPLRMRPVLMTSCAIILAMLPAAVMPGAASSSHRPLALVIIGGMISSTILTLIIVPAIYSLIEGAVKKK